MRYEKPAIITRDSIAGLLRPPKSDPEPDGDSGISDVNRKDNIRPVVWGGPESARVPYATPSIIKRDGIKAYLDAVPRSDPEPDGFDSDVNIKDNIVPVRW